MAMLHPPPSKSNMTSSDSPLSRSNAADSHPTPHSTFATILPTAIPLSGVVVEISPGAVGRVNDWLPHPGGPTARAPVSHYTTNSHAMT